LFSLSIGDTFKIIEKKRERKNQDY